MVSKWVCSGHFYGTQAYHCNRLWSIGVLLDSSFPSLSRPRAHPPPLLVCSLTSRSHQLPCLIKTLPPRGIPWEDLAFWPKDKPQRSLDQCSSLPFLELVWNRTVSRMPLYPISIALPLSIVDSINSFFSWFGKKSTKGGTEKQADSGSLLTRLYGRCQLVNPYFLALLFAAVSLSPPPHPLPQR